MIKPTIEQPDIQEKKLIVNNSYHNSYRIRLNKLVNQENQLKEKVKKQQRTNKKHRRLTKTKDSNVCLLVGCLTFQQDASVSQGWICTDNFTCCHTEIEVADPTYYLTQSQSTDTGPTSPSADPIM